MFKSQAFQDFLEELKRMESFDLQEIVAPQFKGENLDNNEYTFLLRGRLEVYDNIRALVSRVISYATKHALQGNKEGE